MATRCCMTGWDAKNPKLTSFEFVHMCPHFPRPTDGAIPESIPKGYDSIYLLLSFWISVAGEILEDAIFGIPHWFVVRTSSRLPRKQLQGPHIPHLDSQWALLYRMVVCASRGSSLSGSCNRQMVENPTWITQNNSQPGSEQRERPVMLLKCASWGPFLVSVIACSLPYPLWRTSGTCDSGFFSVCWPGQIFFYFAYYLCSKQRNWTQLLVTHISHVMLCYINTVA
jgi:hypothetical protein